MTIKKSYLAKIHIAKQQLGMCDDAYRMLLKRVAGVSSAKDLTNLQAEKIIDELKVKGFKPKKNKKTNGKPHNFNKMPATIEKVEALLTDMSLSWAYADAIAKQMFNIERCAWLDSIQLKAIISALYNKQKRCNNL